MSSFTVSQETRLEVWDAFVKASPQGTIFCESQFLVSLTMPFKCYGVLKGSEMVGGCVILESETGDAIDAPYHFTPYQGLLFKSYEGVKSYKKSEEEFEISNSLISFLMNKYKFFSLAHSPEVKDMRPFLWMNYGEDDKPKFKIDIAYTPILKLSGSSKEIILSQMKQSRRQEYNKDEPDLVIKESSDIDALNKLHHQTFLRQGIQRSEEQEKLLVSISEMSITSGYGRLLLGYKDSVPISAVMFLFDNKRAYYLFGATDPQYRSSTASTKLILEQVFYSSFTRKLPEIDFVGCNSPERGYYKLSFGGDLTPYFETRVRA